jgi:hypothetical protein
MKGKIGGGIGRSQMRKMGERKWKKGGISKCPIGLTHSNIFLILPAKNIHFCHV